MAAADSIGEYLISARSLDEYRAMFAITADAAFHRAALRELMRVCRGEVRVFPLLDQNGRATPELIDDIAAQGISHKIRTVPYEFQRGGNRMLVVQPR